MELVPALAAVACRWAVSGTPINSGLQDLFGLLSFLGSDPYGSKTWWQRVCQGPYEEGCPAGAIPSPINPKPARHPSW